MTQDSRLTFQQASECSNTSIAEGCEEFANDTFLHVIPLESGMPTFWWFDPGTPICWQLLSCTEWNTDWCKAGSDWAIMSKQLWDSNAGHEVMRRCFEHGCNKTRYLHINLSSAMKAILRAPNIRNKYSYEQKPNGLSAAELGDALSYYGVEQVARIAARHWKENWTLNLCSVGGNISKVAQAAKNQKLQSQVLLVLGLLDVAKISGCQHSESTSDPHTMADVFEKALFFAFQFYEKAQFDESKQGRCPWKTSSCDYANLLYITCSCLGFLAIEKELFC